jgi:ArsR family transcriptional regulator, arsenate/arsenite/antimonite-responsive transcriptional repressor
MNAKDAVSSLAALAQESRLAVFRLLVQHGPEGLPAGVISEKVGIPATTMSFHLAQLSHAGLIRQERQGRSLIYSADFAAMQALLDFLLQNCCQGVCPPARTTLGCPPPPPARKTAARRTKG